MTEVATEDLMLDVNTMDPKLGDKTKRMSVAVLKKKLKTGGLIIDNKTGKPLDVAGLEKLAKEKVRFELAHREEVVRVDVKHPPAKKEKAAAPAKRPKGDVTAHTPVRGG